MMDTFEYGIMMRNVEGLHRGPWTREEAESWLKEWVDECDPAKQAAILDLFYVVRRPVGEWETY